MKVCETCGDEIGTKDGDNRCDACENKLRARANAIAKRRDRDQVYRDLGLVKVRGALGGTYWE